MVIIPFRTSIVKSSLHRRHLPSNILNIARPCIVWHEGQRISMVFGGITIGIRQALPFFLE